MNKEAINAAYAEIGNFRDKLGETFFDAVMEDDNTTYEMAKGIIGAFGNCQTDREFEIVDQMLSGICGYNFESLVERIKERDESNFSWQSC